MDEILAAIKKLTDTGVDATDAANLVYNDWARKASRTAQGMNDRIILSDVV